MSILEPCNAACGAAFENNLACEVAACSLNCFTSSQTRLDSCIQTIDNCDPQGAVPGCAIYNNATGCANNLVGASHPAAACFGNANSTFQDLFTAIVPVFCG